MTRVRPRKEAPRGPKLDKLSLIIRARDASRTGWSKKSRLEVDVGSIFDPKTAQMNLKIVQVKSARPSGRPKSRRSGRFVLFVLLVSSRLVVLVVPGGRGTIVAPGKGLPAAS